MAWLFPKCHDLTPWPMVKTGCRCHLGRTWVLLSSRICIVFMRGQVRWLGKWEIYLVLLSLHCAVATGFALMSPNKMSVT